MAFTMDDVIEALRIMKECDDAELRIESGDLKLFIAKGAVARDSAIGFDFAADTAAAERAQARNAPATLAAPPQRNAHVAATPVTGAPPTVAHAIESAMAAGLVPIRATVTSVFYRKPNPDEPPFVDIGSEVDEDTIVCLLDVMKCYHSVPAGVRGRIEEILVESGDLVETDAVMFLVKPA